MRTLSCENLRSEPFPDSYWKFIDRRNTWNQRNAWTGSSPAEIELFSNALILKFTNSVGNAIRSLYRRRYVGSITTNSRCGQLDGTQKCFRQRLRNKGSGFCLGAEITFSVKFQECEVDRRSRDSQVGSQRTCRRKPGSAVAKATRSQLIANLTIELLVQRFGGRAIESNHLKRDDRTPASFVWE